MKLRNYVAVRWLFGRLYVRLHLEERVLVLALELVGPKKLKTPLCFFRVETLLGRLKQLEDIVDLYRL